MRLLRVLLAGLLMLEVLYFVFDHTAGIVIETPEIRDDVLANVFGRVRVVQLSDLHVTRYGLLERRLVNTVKHIDPDIVFVTGDLIAGNHGIDACVDVFRDLVPGRVVIAILGNNDHPYREHYVDTGRLVSELRAVGVRVLVNESVRLSVPIPGAPLEKSAIYVVGVDDNFSWRDDIFKATTNISATDERILLAHAPHIGEKVSTEHVRLILSGHTHGGQIALPFIGALYTNPQFRSRKKLVAGLYSDDANVYVNRGIGTVMIPLRFCARPEITVFRFVKNR